jgi:TRAP-type C4-dicarboxylate transport system permease small subunit
MSGIFDLVVKLLPPALRPFAKAVIPALATVIAVAAQWLSTGSFDQTAMVTAITGLATAILAYFTTNTGQPPSAGPALQPS